MSREDAGVRLARLLAVVPWIAAQPDGATPDEIASQFGTTVAKVEKDLRLLGEVEPEAQMNVLMYEDDGRWYVDAYTHLARPFRITADEAFGLMVSAQSILAVPGLAATDALVSAIGKVARAVGGDVAGLEVHLPQPPALPPLQDATRDGACVEIEYYAATRDTVTTRVVEPLALFTVEARWHLIGFCRGAEAERDFRVDRVRAVRATGESFAKRAPTMRTDVAFDPLPDITTVRIEVQAGQRWALDRYPVRDVEERPDGAARFTLEVSGDPWLERLLLRLGPTARVIEPAGSITGREAAARLRQLYV